MTITQIARQSVAFTQGALMSGSEIKKLQFWVSSMSAWEQSEFQKEIDRLQAESLKGERRL